MCLCSGYKGEREFLLAPAVYRPEIRAYRCICRHLHLINHDIHLSRELNVVQQHIINYITERQWKSSQRTRQDSTRRRTRRRKAKLHPSASTDDALKVQPCFQLLPMDAQKERNVLAMYILCSLSTYI